ncbi:MAG: malto-oligosyltrehalose synthase [Planctomycetaceae bacterium]
MTEAATLVSEDLVDQRALVNRLPRATYRLQLRGDFGFRAVRDLVDYLDALGVTDLYLSPLFHSREDSPHGYDVVDHSVVEPTFGDLSSLRELSQQARRLEMGILLDIVPNHMGINDPGNLYWNDVLENGPAARSAIFFDIDWHPPGGNLDNRVLLPFLGRPFGEALEAGELQVVRLANAFALSYFERRFPLTPASWAPLLTDAIVRLPATVDEDEKVELLSIISQLGHLPSIDVRGEAGVEELYREQSVARRRLGELLERSTDIRNAVDQAVTALNGDPTNPQSFDLLEQLIQRQHYRLAFWQVAVDEINYRRFFDINDLAAIRVEEPQVFQQAHGLTFELLKQGVVTGLRIDHCDGLLDPGDYFKQLQAVYRQMATSDADRNKSLYVVAEKILADGEPLPSDWAISGTTGYDFLNQVASVLVDCAGVAKLQAAYPALTGVDLSPREIAYQSKLTILHDAMSSELFVLASRLFRLARAHRHTYDFTLPVLLRALREVIACFTVYRTYTRPYGWDVSNDDTGRIREALRWAKLRNPLMAWPAFDFIGKVLLLEFPPHLGDELQAQWRQLAVRLQQVTGPVTAKGIEDTAFYRYYPLVSLNEVGAEVGTSGKEPDEFHRVMQHRIQDWPRAMSATATHDTKRGEDFRCRLHVLSELPDEYASDFSRWDEQVQSLTTTINGSQVPDANERYFIHQTLVGTWPVTASSTPVDDHYLSRMHAYFEKAFREAKVQTSWRSPSQDHEAAVKTFVADLLSDSSSEPFKSIASLARRIAPAGYLNSLSQVVLKATLPGVPDFYQGSEMWDFHLVDPDNRQAVDYDHQRAALKDLQARYQADPQGLFRILGRDWSDHLKLLVTMRVLDARRQHWPVFASGDYQPLEVEGDRARHLLAFARRHGDQWMMVVVPRLPFGLGKHAAAGAIQPLEEWIGGVWDNTKVRCPASAPDRWHDHLAGRPHQASQNTLAVSDLFQDHAAVVLFA